MKVGGMFVQNAVDLFFDDNILAMSKKHKIIRFISSN